MFPLRRSVMAFVLPCFFIGCIGPRGGLFRGQTPGQIEQTAAETGKTIYVVGHGWHTGIVLKMDDVAEPLRPGSSERIPAKYVELGWGDEGFYRAKSINPAVAFRAIFTPTPSVMHVVAFEPPPEDVFVGSDVIAINISDEEFNALCDYVRDSFETDDNGEATHLGPGIYGDSAFYRGKGSYYYPKTCNVWTARVLQAGGVPILTAFATTAGGLISQSKLHGRALRTSSPLAMFHALGIGKPAAK